MDTPKRILLQSVKRKRRLAKQKRDLEGGGSNSDSSDWSSNSDEKMSPQQNDHIFYHMTSRLPETPLRCFREVCDDEDRFLSLSETPPHNDTGFLHPSPSKSIDKAIRVAKHRVRMARRLKHKRQKMSSFSLDANCSSPKENISLDSTFDTINMLKEQLDNITSRKKQKNNLFAGETNSPDKLLNNKSILEFSVPASSFEDKTHNYLLDDSTSDDLLIQCLDDAEQSTQIIKDEGDQLNSLEMLDGDDDYFLSIDTANMK